MKLPPGTEHENDFAMLADIFPTGYHAVAMAAVSPGETVAVYGSGPVGLMAAYSSVLRGAAKVFVVDTVRDRLRLAEEIGAIPVDFSVRDPLEARPARGPGRAERGGRRGQAPDQHRDLLREGPADGTGQADVKAYNRHPRDLIVAGRATPSFVLAKELPLEEAQDAYQRFDKREEGYGKVLRRPRELASA